MAQRRIPGKKSIRDVAVSLLCAGAFLLALIVAVAPGLHSHLHDDAGHPQHECAITIVESGIESGDAPAKSARPESATLFATVPALNPVSLPSPFLSSCAFEHAPPALS